MNPRAEASTWLMVFALGRIEPLASGLFAVEFLRTLEDPLGAVLLVLSLRRARDEGGVVMCSFCWCLNKRSRRAKHRVHSLHANGFSLVWERSCLFKCSNRAKDLVQVAQTCGLGLSVLGGGMLGLMSWEAPTGFA